MSSNRFRYGRLYLSLFMIIMLFVLVMLRHAYLASNRQSFLLGESKARTERTLAFVAQKGKMIDRNGYPLAISMASYRLAINPEKYHPDAQSLKQLSEILNVDLAIIEKKIRQSSRKKYVVLAKRLSRKQVLALSKLSIDGVIIDEQKGRYYPLGEAASTVVGYVDTEGNGQIGMEYQFNQYIEGQDGTMSYTQNLLNQVAKIHYYQPSIAGNELRLTLDYRLQYLAHNALKNAVMKHNAQYASAVVLSVHDGEVLAIANYPSFDANQPIRILDETIKNHAISDLFEPGSIIKPIALAGILGYGLHDPQESIDATGGHYLYEGREFRDHKDLGIMRFEDILLKSSNIAMVKLTSQLPPGLLVDTYDKFGLFSPLFVQLPGEAQGRHVQHPSLVDEAAMSYGYGVSVNLLSMARAYNIIANGGKDPGVHLVFEHHRPDAERIIPENIALRIKDMMVRVTEKGHSKLSNIKYISVAGKSGTSHLLGKDGAYENAYVATFAGFAPSDHPKVVIAVMVYKPTKNGHYGGQTAAPVFANIMADTLSYIPREGGYHGD